MNNATIEPLDIVEVKAGILAGRLFVQVKNTNLLLCDSQTGEAVKLADIEVKRLVHATWEKSDIPQEKYKCSACGGACWYYDFKADVARSKFCPNCGAKMDGDPGEDT